MTKDDSVRAGRILDAQIHLLDRQVLDPDSVPVTTIDSLELTDVPIGEDLDPNADAPVIVGLLTGPVLATRIFGGRPPRSRWERIPWADVRKIGIVISVDNAADSYDLNWTERWVRDRIIGRIPGGHHDPQ